MLQITSKCIILFCTLTNEEKLKKKSGLKRDFLKALISILKLAKFPSSHSRSTSISSYFKSKTNSSTQTVVD